ncbi:hypothetical protein M406DRAFT_348078 [Cryphonectria parasitica EP155]|uniref:LCCL domain-containing protein n=1 Tax=Cryphonectria parasitica (strain ATCC 38755 / EP155) TaxID=660469 RepID=A0A9P4XWB4_CRYP1|nr:uncharacterized protein M406DRAFT_348078 [Cryphonectria parasitica EP155]KAF3761965.1 hypothetical protein M406DRAFT_348078 [Cryphonectria parasitica EP155]
MAGPDALLRDPESCVRQTTADESAHKAFEKARDNPDERRLPPSIQRRSDAICTYLKGPDPPRIWKIRPILPRLQHLPLRLVDKFCPRQWQRILALFLFYVCWIATFGAVLHKSAVADDVNGYGQPVQIQCGGVFWEENNDCGLNGTDCLPFADSSFAFRCPANCISEEVQNPRAVGAQEVIYEPLVVGGPTSDGTHDFTYRGDSFICSAAIHAGVIANGVGGCGVVSLIGQQSNYPSVTRNGISSIGFDSSFPSSFTFTSTTASCRDLSWDLLAVSVVYTTLLSLFTRSASVFFYTTVVGCYLQAALATDTPEYASIATLVSTAIGKLLPALFIAMVMYRLYIRRTLHDLTAQVEKTILWLGPCWVAVLADYTFELIPLERLTEHDLRQEPGGLASLIIIVVVLLCAFIGQAWAFRREGRLLRYLALYVSLGITIGLLAAIPQEDLRLHHYILGLLLIPGTSLQTRPSLVYQGILVGLFINGVAKWGFDAILQTAAELQGDALDGSALPVITALNATVSSITFTWPGVPAGWNGTSVLVNDVERYRDYSSSQDERSFTWQRAIAGEPEYFRFGFFALSAAYGLETGDYTMGGTWLANGTWIQMAAGAT